MPVFPSPAEVVRMMNDRVAYERAKTAFITEEETKVGPKPQPQPRTNSMWSIERESAVRSYP